MALQAAREAIREVAADHEPSGRLPGAVPSGRLPGALKCWSLPPEHSARDGLPAVASGQPAGHSRERGRRREEEAEQCTHPHSWRRIVAIWE
ncbi:MAG: hypothetical protein ACYDHH_00585 [Solirubrobacteraceae bacterium]